ncbi:glycosyltransferase involved in cell wall biosynthesis [Thermodesulfitimonas autotrophica]|uniref:Glycosyltransferase involved in cell wall biosynthesis n=1 Tax=Thermodesulfitimonas autotrophica TaxID=1894989 RepID=A0A3N5AFK9_9THEO|nr:glycosyltransferase family 4 protein [Thermodesulfitimonas autotrophica]RPF42750.1 glycosyltransferase involved in cell wall biosynthesis [Thermodesulfitimonas autotrophica]
MGRPRVLFVATVARHLLAFHQPYFRLLQEWGYAVDVACNPAGEAASFASLGVRLHPVPFERRPFSRQNLRAGVALWRLCRQESYALVHVHTPVAAFIARLVLRLRRFRPVLYTAHGFHFFRGAPLVNWLLYFPLEWLAARWTDGLILLNPEDYARAKRLPVRGAVFLVPGVGVDAAAFTLPPGEAVKRRQEFGLQPETPVAAVVAELSRVKNHEQIFRAWRLVVRELPEAVLLVAGEGERRRVLEGLAAQLGIAAHVRFLGFYRDIPALLSVADAVVLTSKREGLPRVILEAMAAGRPVVATDVRGNRDLVVDGETGYLVRVGDVAGTAAAVLRLLRNREGALRMGAAGRRRLEPYAIEKVVAQVAQIYQRYLAGAPGGKAGSGGELM